MSCLLDHPFGTLRGFSRNVKSTSGLQRVVRQTASADPVRPDESTSDVGSGWTP
jgi:hypothetical protein